MSSELKKFEVNFPTKQSTKMGSVGLDKRYFCRLEGSFKLAQFVTALIVAIAIGTTGFGRYAGTGVLAFVQFVGAFVCITLIISFVIYFFKLYNLPLVKGLPWKLLEVGYSLLCAVFLFIAMCICAANTNWGDWKSKLITGAIFSAISMVIFLVFAFLVFRGMELQSTENDGSSVQT